MLATFCNAIIEKICVMPRVFYHGGGMFVSISVLEPEREGGLELIDQYLNLDMVEEKIMFTVAYSTANMKSVIKNHIGELEKIKNYERNVSLSVSDLGQIPAYMLERDDKAGYFRFDVTDLDETKFKVLADTFLAYYPHILANPGVTPKPFAEHDFSYPIYKYIKSELVEVGTNKDFILRWDEVTFEKTRYVLSGEWNKYVRVNTQEDPRIGLLQMGKILACTLDQELNTCTFYDHSKNLDDIIKMLKNAKAYSQDDDYERPAKRAKTSGDE